MQFRSEEIRRMEDHALPHVHPRQLDRNRMSTVSVIPLPEPELAHTLHVLEVLGAIKCGVAEPHNRNKRRRHAPARDEIEEE
jgi:hypothetical protein